MSLSLIYTPGQTSHQWREVIFSYAGKAYIGCIQTDKWLRGGTWAKQKECKNEISRKHGIETNKLIKNNESQGK